MTDACPSDPVSLTPEFALGPAPDWVEDREIPQLSEPYLDPVSLPLVDRQVLHSNRVTYSRTVKRLNNGQAVQHGSRVEIDFDPSAEKVVVHHVAVIRDGKRREHADAKAFRIVQREANLDQHILDGRLSALLFLEDVRAGDLVDVAYTVTETRTAFPGKFSTGQFTQFPLEVGGMFLTIRCEETADELEWQCDDERVEGAVEESDGKRIYRWKTSEPRRIRIPAGVPEWHSLSPILWVSDFGSWAEVASMASLAWTESLDQDEDRVESESELDRRVAAFEELQLTGADLADRVIRFVQDEIRYLSLETGMGCFLPQAPGKVLARRFGDCKDKSVLLAELLNRLGIFARPVLVSAQSQHNVAKMLPTPRAFDHVIVAFEIDGERRYVDPTISYQGGAEAKRFLPRFGFGLLVDENSTDLESLPAPDSSAGSIEINEAFDFGKKNAPIDLTVTTVAHGADADFLRHQLDTVSHEQIEREFESRYRRFFRDLTPCGRMETQDDTEKNVVTLEHRYRIGQIETRDTGGGRVVYHFPAHTLEGRLVGCNEARRTAPLAVTFPCHVTHCISVTLPRRPGVATLSDLAVEDPAFRFKVDTSQAGKTATATFVLESRADHVPARFIPAYMEKLNEAYDMMGFNVPAGFQFGFNRETLRRAAVFAGGFILIGAWIMAMTSGLRDAADEEVPRQVSSIDPMATAHVEVFEGNPNLRAWVEESVERYRSGRSKDSSSMAPMPEPTEGPAIGAASELSSSSEGGAGEVTEDADVVTSGE